MIKTRKFRGDLGALYGGMFRFMCVCVCVCGHRSEFGMIWFIWFYERAGLRYVGCVFNFWNLDDRIFELEYCRILIVISVCTICYWRLYVAIFFCYMLTLRIMSVFTLLNKVCVPSVSHQFCNKRSTLPSWNY